MLPNVCKVKPTLCRALKTTFCQMKIYRLQRRYVTHEWATKNSKSPAVEKEDMSMIRNIGILAHIDAGKTTTSERMLYYSGFSKHLGDVDSGDTVMDYMSEERERGITITSAAITLHWKKHKINLIDTPGHVDFTVEVERCLRVLDSAVVILDSSAGVEAQTQTVWKQADRYSIPRIVYLNKLDKPGATIDKCLTSLKDKFKIDPLVVQLPLGSGKDFRGVVDLITMEKIEWDPKDCKDGQKYSVTKLTKSDTDVDFNVVLKARSALIGQLSEFDEHLSEEILNDVEIEDFSAESMYTAIRNSTINRQVIPVLCGSSLKNKGVQPLLDAIANYLPSPLDRNYEFANYYGTDLCALAFKIIHHQQRGALTFLRLYTGTLQSGANIYNINQDCSEKIGRLVQVYADEYHDINLSTAGNIVCVSGLKQTRTGDTITSTKASALSAITEHKVKQKLSDDTDNSGAVLAGLKIPTPVFFCAVEPPSLAYVKALDEAFACLQREDPSLKVEVNEDTEQTILSGMGELHLEIIKNRLKRDYKIDAFFGDLQIAYRETISCEASEEEHLDKQIGDQRHHVKMTLTVEPDDSKPSFKFVELCPLRDQTLDHVRKSYKIAIENGISAALMCGNLLSYPVINVNVKLHSFEMGRGTSLPMISACATSCIHRLLKQAGPKLLEPMMKLSISTDEERLHAVLGDLSHRRSHIQNVESGLDETLIEAVTPLAELVGYSTILRTLTSGTASVSMELSHYEVMTEHDQNQVILKHTGVVPPS